MTVRISGKLGLKGSSGLNFRNVKPYEIKSLQWNSSTDAYVTTNSGPLAEIHNKMRRCVLKLDGTVNYYLDPNDSTKKADGSAAVLTGTDGYVMVEIPKFWIRQNLDGTVFTWDIADGPAAGFSVHPAFIKDGVEVNYRYYGAYDACFWDATDGIYKSGLNLDNASALISTAADRLASVAGVYPIVGVTRAECRSMAANNGTGWRQVDFWLMSAVQMLFLAEHGTFRSQQTLGDGNTNGAYLNSSSNQNDSPHTIAGASNSLGNASTNTTTGAGVNAKPGTSFMSYRGIENWYGNASNWIDGWNVNVGSAGTCYVSNTRAHFADNTATNYTLLTTSLPTGSGFIRNILPITGAFLASSVSGGSSGTFLADQQFGSTSTNRVALFGGASGFAASAGAFCVFLSRVSSFRGRDVSARVSF